LAARSVNDRGAIAAEAGVFGETGVAALGPIDSPPGDLTRDCTVDIDDLTQLFEFWGTESTGGDVNRDGRVDVGDLLILLSDWTN